MKKILLLVASIALVFTTVYFSTNAKNSPAASKELTATIKTTKGEIVLKLYGNKAPLTVANFVNLAKRGYYDGLKFHRVIPNFMIQGGCPYGNGTGDPGYKFADEFVPEYRHDGPGVLSMANSGPATNGSQFFITHVATPWLNDKHAIFGKVISGQDVVNAIVGNDVITTIVISGDNTPEMKAQQSKVDEWNKILDSKFPKLKAAVKM